MYIFCNPGLLSVQLHTDCRPHRWGGESVDRSPHCSDRWWRSTLRCTQTRSETVNDSPLPMQIILCVNPISDWLHKGKNSPLLTKHAGFKKLICPTILFCLRIRMLDFSFYNESSSSWDSLCTLVVFIFRVRKCGMKRLNSRQYRIRWWSKAAILFILHLK